MNMLLNKKLMVKTLSSKWVFPILLLILVIIMSILKLSGSSVGQYNIYLYGNDYQDPNIVLNKPLSIRSDEWLVNTPLTVAQYKENYPKINKNIGLETDLSVFTDIPTRDWSTIFKPQNIPFLIFPIEVAFAFKWWFLGLVLIIGSYLFILELAPRKKVFAILLSIGIFFIPFIQWWYSPGSILPFAYLLLILTLLVRLNKPQSNITKNLLIAAALAYLFVCFALILYPPFQIPCVLVGIAFYLGFLVESKTPKKQLLKILGFVGLGLIIALVLIGLFVLTKSDIIQSTANTSYPGKRVVESGGYALSYLFSGIYNYRLECCGQYGYINQSETSNFILLIPALFVALIYFVKSKKIRDKSIFLLLFGVLSIFFVHLFIPAPLLFGKLFLLDKVPLNRLLYGIGIANILLIITFMYYSEKSIYKKLPIWVIIAAISLQSIIGLFVFYSLKHNFPQYLGSSKREVLVALTVNALVALSIYLLFTKRFKMFAGLFLFSMFMSSYTVNPIYRGLQPLLNNPIVDRISELNSESPGIWASIDDIYLLNIPAASGVDSITTTYFYPQLNIWKDLDPSGKYTNVYNRYSKVSFTTDKYDELINPIPRDISNNNFDSISVYYNSCSPFMLKNVQYVISAHPIYQGCLIQDNLLDIGQRKFWFYRVSN